jgi:hypothetical protein
MSTTRTVATMSDALERHGYELAIGEPAEPLTLEARRDLVGAALDEAIVEHALTPGLPTAERIGKLAPAFTVLEGLLDRRAPVAGPDPLDDAVADLVAAGNALTATDAAVILERSPDFAAALGKLGRIVGA